jgi:hypothetical protein
MRHATANMSDSKLGQSQEWGYSVEQDCIELFDRSAKRPRICPGPHIGLVVVQEGRESGAASEPVADLDEI